ncbi:sugar phosphate isomerase/epimerase family protein [Gryllotalpicola reticulitermitis]|uniref:Sugar phosphate isomerase/epimerase family protein n=1 Tax=Gryllotalpicola reticulitermitis TaxID=1184153 RepID=A0ABV8Q6H0_9MICO
MHITPSAAASITNVAQMRESASFIRAFELSVDFALDELPDQLFDEIAELRSDGVRFSVHAPFRDLNIASLNPGAYEAARADMMRAVEVADRIGAEVVNVHPGIHGYFPPQHWPRMKELERNVYEDLSDYGSARGIRIVAENLIKTNVHFEDTWTLDGVIALHDAWRSELKGVCLDTGHANQAGLDVAAAVRRLGPRVKHLHLQDNHGGPIDEHLPIGDGLIDWDSVFTALEEVDFTGFAVFEFGPAPRQREAVEMLVQRFGERAA